MVVERSEGSVHVVLEFVGNERERDKQIEKYMYTKYHQGVRLK